MVLTFRDSGITVGLDGAIQRLVVNGDIVAAADLLQRARDSRGIRRWVGSSAFQKINGDYKRKLFLDVQQVLRVTLSRRQWVLWRRIPEKQVPERRCVPATPERVQMPVSAWVHGPSLRAEHRQCRLQNTGQLWREDSVGDRQQDHQKVRQAVRGKHCTVVGGGMHSGRQCARLLCPVRTA